MPFGVNNKILQKNLGKLSQIYFGLVILKLPKGIINDSKTLFTLFFEHEFICALFMLYINIKSITLHIILFWRFLATCSHLRNIYST